MSTSETPPTPMSAEAAEKPATAPLPQELEQVAENYRRVYQRVQQAATGAAPVRLVAVSKTKPVALMQAAYDAGCRIFGENYVQELVDKVRTFDHLAAANHHQPREESENSQEAPLYSDIEWHFIGSLQSNKANLLVQSVQPIGRLVVETVGSIKLANKLDKAVENAASAGPEQNNKLLLRVFVQINTSGEDTKSGVDPGPDALELGRHVVQHCPHLRLGGLMTIGAPGDVGCFATLSQCRAEMLAQSWWPTDSFLELSMGMSGDFEAAIAAGSTHVRVGSTIFGARDYSQPPPPPSSSSSTTNKTK